MSKQLLFDDEARKKLLIGVETVFKAVKTTLGAKGRLVYIDNKMGKSIITKDGVRVAQSIELKDPFENMGAKLIKEVASKTDEIVSDGPQPLYAKILTPTGWTTMGELKVGDTICGTNKTTQTVEGIFPKGEKEIVEMIFSDGRKVECSLDHLWQVHLTSRGTKKIVNTNELLKDYKKDSGGYPSYKYYIPNTVVDFEKKELPIDPFTLGVILGDGYIPNDRNYISITLGYNKKAIMDKWIFPSDSEIDIKDFTERNCYDVHIKSETLSNILLELGLKGVHSDTKFIPKEYLYSSYEQRLSLLDGLSSTDGYINKRGLMEYSTVSDDLKNNVIELLQGLGKCTHYKYHNRDNDKDSYSNKAIHRLTELKGYEYGHKLVDIRLTGKTTEMMCIKVSNDDHLYITNDYIPTHNTTSSTVLAYSLVKEGLKSVSSGIPPMEIKKGIEKAIHLATEDVKKQSKPIKSVEELKQVASISANNDEEIGNIIAEAVEKVGKDGVITVAESNTTETFINFVEGMQFDRGYISPYFATDPERMITEFDNPYILVCDKQIGSMRELLPLLEKVVQTGRPLFMIVDDLKGEALTSLIMNVLQGKLRLCAVKSPSFGDNRKQMLEDIAILTGATVISESMGYTLDKVELDDLGSCKSIKVSKDTTIIVDGNSLQEELEERITQIKNQIPNTTSDFDKEKLKERLAKLSGGVAVINIGAITETEMTEKKHRIEDTLASARSSLEEGIVCGGGVALIHAIKSLEKEDTSTMSEGMKVGFNIVKRAMEEPIRQIAENSGVSGEVVADRCKNSKKGVGFNALNGEWVDMFEEGIIDPCKVTCTVLQNASSIASLLLTTECLITDDVEVEK